MRSDREWLSDILEAIDKITQHTNAGKEAFDNDEMTQVWVLHHIQIIGEAAGRLSDGLREAYPGVPWSDIIAMRNVLVHHYFGIDLIQTWSTVENDLPMLRHWITDILQNIASEPD